MSARVPPPTTVHANDGRGGPKTSPMVTLDADSSRSWTTVLAALLADPSRPKSAGIRRHARKLLRLVAKSRDAYHAVRDAAALETHARGFDTAALPRPGPRLAERSPHAAMLFSMSQLSSCADIAGARPKSWRSFVASRPGFLRTIARFAPWVPERSQLDALKLLTHAMSGSPELRAPGATLGLGSGGRLRVIRPDEPPHSTLTSSGESHAKGDSASDEAALEIVAGDFDQKNGFSLFSFVTSHPSASVRSAAAAALRAAWRTAPPDSRHRASIAGSIFSSLPALARVGRDAADAVALLVDVVAQAPVHTRVGMRRERYERYVELAHERGDPTRRERFARVLDTAPVGGQYPTREGDGVGGVSTDACKRGER